MNFKRTKVFFLSAFLSFITFVQICSGQVIQGEVTPGTYKPLRADLQGHLIPADYFSSIAFGDDSTNLRRVTGLGNNPIVASGTVPEDVWSGGGIYPWLTTSTALEAISDSASDTAAGIGARTISLSCLDGNYVELASQVITLNGLTPVAFSVPCFRTQQSLVISAGSNQTNVGNINIRDVGGGTVRAIIPAGYGITKQSQYTVPAGHTLQVVSLYIAALKSTGAALSIDMATYFKSAAGVYRLPVTVSTGSNGVYRHDSLPGITAAEKTDFQLRVMDTSGTANISGAWLGYIRKNTP